MVTGVLNKFLNTHPEVTQFLYLSANPECRPGKKEKNTIIVKKTRNLTKWLFVWYKNSPPSVEYIERLLIKPKIKTHMISIKSNDLNF